jgi:hypothetical protein
MIELNEKQEKKIFTILRRIGRYAFNEKVRDIILRDWSEHYIYKKKVYVMGKDAYEPNDIAVMRVHPFDLNDKSYGEGLACVEVHFGKDKINQVILCNLNGLPTKLNH